jgi:hypothetical protein
MFAIFIGFITKITLYFEFEVSQSINLMATPSLQIKHVEECLGTMSQNALGPSLMAVNYYYNLLWKIGFRNLITVWIPFLLLLLMNLKIIHVLRNSETETIVKEKLSEIQRKSRVRAATRTLTLIVFTYLLANVLNVILTLCVRINQGILSICGISGVCVH